MHSPCEFCIVLEANSSNNDSAMISEPESPNPVASKKKFTKEQLEFALERSLATV